MKGLVVTILFFCMTGCTNKDIDIKGILSKEKMQAVMWDIIGADVFTEQYVKKESLKNASVENMRLQNKIFALHNVSRVDFYKSYDYYVEHTNLMKVMLDSMTAQAERNRSKMMERQVEGVAKISRQQEMEKVGSLKRPTVKIIYPISPENQGKDSLHRLPIGFLKND
jgi:hypothetical protein